MWAGLAAPDSEVFTLVWESKALIALNNAIASFMAQQAYQEIAKWTLTHFFYTGLVAAFATPWLLVSFSQVCKKPLQRRCALTHLQPGHILSDTFAPGHACALPLHLQNVQPCCGAMGAVHGVWP